MPVTLSYQDETVGFSTKNLRSVENLNHPVTIMGAE
jgi:hypothetical protein